MASKDMSVALTLILVMIQFVGFGSADINADIGECQNELLVLEPCLTYVQGGSKTPTLDCCGGVKQVLQKSKVCLCVLVKDRDDPDIGFKFNATLALGLPHRCNAPSNVNECPCKYFYFRTHPTVLIYIGVFVWSPTITIKFLFYPIRCTCMSLIN